MSKHRKQGSFRTEQLDLSGTLARSAEPGVVFIDEARRIALFNLSAERLTQLHAADIVGDGIEVLPAPLAETIDEVFNSAGVVVDRALVLQREGKLRTVVLANALPVRGGSGDALGVLLTFHDLSSAREFELKVERLQRLAILGVVSAGVAHEIKNALVAIKSFSELLLEKQQDHEMVGLVVQEVNRINSLACQLMRLAGPTHPVFSEVNVHESLQNALRLVKHQVKNRSIELEIELEAPQVTIRGDAKQLEQAFINLLLNAVEAMGDTGRLKVSTQVVYSTEFISKFEPRTHRQQLQITIQDTGPGISAHIHANLFSPFQTTKPGGTGLGLVITRRIVVSHGGLIKVESEPNRGACFRITFPLVPAKIAGIAYPTIQPAVPVS
jgi:two-component system, NtrC family, nitrogen regulation sensor histidine kinase GlnL